jgi:hypothetical protein
VQDASHDEHVRVWKGILEEISRLENQSAVEPVFRDVSFEGQLHVWKIEAATGEMRMRLCNLHQHASLCGSDIEHRSVRLPRKLLSE